MVVTASSYPSAMDMLRAAILLITASPCNLDCGMLCSLQWKFSCRICGHSRFEVQSVTGRSTQAVLLFQGYDFDLCIGLHPDNCADHVLYSGDALVLGALTGWVGGFNCWWYLFAAAAHVCS